VYLNVKFLDFVENVHIFTKYISAETVMLPLVGFYWSLFAKNKD
jgi:hypothetical protein